MIYSVYGVQYEGENIYVKKTSDTRYNLIMDIITVTQVRPNASTYNKVWYKGTFIKGRAS